MNWTHRHRLTVILTILLTLIGLALSHYLPKPPLASLYPSSTAIYARHGELLRLTLAKDQQYRLWLPLHQIPEAMRNATLLYEDRWFYQHPGVNPWALLRSAWLTYAQSERQGASTLTMQMARQLYALNSRNLPGKIRQIALAFWLELRYSKDELLEAYLNTAPYGGNISGVTAASLVYFHKPVAQLTLTEALTLAVIPQNPARRSPSNGLPPALSEARQRLWQRWLKHFPEDKRYAADFALPLLVYARADKPFIAPHLTNALLRRYPSEHHIKSSINLPVQLTIKQGVDNYITQNRTAGIRNAAVLLLDTTTMEVNALVGSANFWDTRIAGQVNGVSAKRSPGSSLKPFVYALALDQGLIHPRTILTDTPTSFGPYNPENFDGRFIGPITAQNALIRSRNIPALNLAAKLSKPDLHGFLQQAGITHLDSGQHYGLSLALGGGEVTMEELARLYALLANRGELRALQYRTDRKDDAAPIALISPAAAFITLDMLSYNARPDSGQAASPKVAWKTGTSWGFKDAWATGIIGHYVLVVWVGDFDNGGNTAFVGIKTAAPLFFTLIDSLRHQRLLAGLDTDLPNNKPDNVIQIEVCAASGDLPNEDCPALAKTWFIPGKSPIKASTLHKAIYFDQDNGEVVCKSNTNSRKEIYEFWPSGLSKLFAEAGMPRRQPPPLPSCYDSQTAEGPQIISPSMGSTYTLRLGKPTSIGLRANSGNGGAIFWFANKSVIGKTNASEGLSWQPSHPGRYLIRAVDAQGRSASRNIAVEFVP